MLIPDGSQERDSVPLENIEYALSLFDFKESDREPGPGTFWRLVLYYVVILSCLVAGLLGLLVIWFDPAVGIASLSWFAISALTAIFFLFRDPRVGRSANLMILRAFMSLALKRYSVAATDFNLMQSRPKYTEHISSCSDILYIVLLVLAPGSAVTGLIWLIVDLVRLGHITAIPLLWLALFVLGGAIWFGIDDFTDQWGAFKLWNQLRLLKQDAIEQGTTQVFLDWSNYHLLWLLEQQKVEKLQQLYAVAISPAANERLSILKAKELDLYYQIRDTLNSLESDPQPRSAVALPEQRDTFQLAVDKYRVIYAKDSVERKILILGLDENGRREAPHAS